MNTQIIKECRFLFIQILKSLKLILFGSPINYVMAQENYKPNGWLGIQLGKAIYIQGHSISTVERNLPGFIERVKTAMEPVTLTPIVHHSLLHLQLFKLQVFQTKISWTFLKCLRKISIPCKIISKKFKRMFKY